MTSSRFLGLLYTPPTSGMGIWSSGVFAGVPLEGSTSRATGAAAGTLLLATAAGKAEAREDGGGAGETEEAAAAAWCQDSSKT